MKKILILCRRDDRTEYDRRISMLAALGKIKTEVTYEGADYEDLLFTYDGKIMRIIDTVSGADIADYDAIFLVGWFKTKSLDDTARAVAHYARAHNIPCKNTEAYDGRSFTKLSQCVIAALNGISVTPFVFSLDQRIVLAAAKSMPVGSPYIAKAIAASRGQDNYLITDYTQLETAVAEVTEKPRYFILQTYVPNDGDYRILVMGDAVSLVIHRKSQGESHLNNTSQGGAATLIEITQLPKKVIEDALKMAKLLKREITGVDMIMHNGTGEYYFLEANNMPQLATGSFVQKKIQALDTYFANLITNNE
jgi:glutathione synthase/RimK-type ligase-like ATP-grasp enzyme